MLHCPAAYRQAMLPIFHDAFIPVQTSQSTTVLSQWLQPWSLCSQAAVEAIGLLQMAAALSDAQVLDKARERLLVAVGGLKMAIVKQNLSMEAINAATQAIMLSQVDE